MGLYMLGPAWPEARTIFERVVERRDVICCIECRFVVCEGLFESDLREDVLNLRGVGRGRGCVTGVTGVAEDFASDPSSQGLTELVSGLVRPPALHIAAEQLLHGGTSFAGGHGAQAIGH
jgi:hypothetical protein